MEDDKLILDNLINLAHTDIELATQLNKGLQLMDEVELRRIYFKPKLLFELFKIIHRIPSQTKGVFYGCPYTVVDINAILMRLSNGFFNGAEITVNGGFIYNWAGRLRFSVEIDYSLPYGVFIFVENKKL